MMDYKNFQHFGQRYHVKELDSVYETQYEAVAIGYGMPDVKMTTKDVRMVTIKLPMENLDEIIDDLEMKVDEVRLRQSIPALGELYQKYQMLLELYK